MNLHYDPQLLRAQYAAAEPFPHIALDGLFDDEALAVPTAAAALLALRQQQVIAEETGVTRPAPSRRPSATSSTR